MGEELGFVGVSVVLICIAVMLWRGVDCDGDIGVKGLRPVHKVLAFRQTLETFAQIRRVGIVNQADMRKGGVGVGEFFGFEGFHAVFSMSGTIL